MSRSIKIEIVRVGDLHPGDVIRFQHPLDGGTNKRKSNWLLVTEEPKPIDHGKVVLVFNGPREARTFPSPYELVEVQVASQPAAPPVELPDQNFLIEGHWRVGKDGKQIWVEPGVLNPRKHAEDIMRFMEANRAEFSDFLDDQDEDEGS